MVFACSSTHLVTIRTLCRSTFGIILHVSFDKPKLFFMGFYGLWSYIRIYAYLRGILGGGATLSKVHSLVE